MVSFKTLKNTFIQADLFYTNELLKYRKDSNYKTMTGAIVSLALTVAILIGFSSMIISMFKKTTIEASFESSKMQSPTNIKLNSSNNNFMFGIMVHTIDYSTYFDLTNGPQLFDVALSSFSYENGAFKSFQPTVMQSCTRQHWKAMPNLVKNFDSLQIGKWLCPPLNFTMELEGVSSGTFETSLVHLYNCTNSTFNGNKCASQNQIDNAYNQYGNFMIRLAFINPIINPSNPNPSHISYYLQENNLLLFSSALGGQMTIEFSDYQINTDGNILPFQSIETQKGYIVEDLSRAASYSLKPGSSPAFVYFRKSANKLTYSRTVLKISAVISYVGGLIGALISVLFMLKSHTQFSFLMALSIDLFTQKKDYNIGDQIKSQKKKLNYSLFKILKFYLYRIKFFFTKDYGEETELMKKMKRCQKQISKQLDIKVLLQRLIKLEQCVCFLFDEAQIEGLKHLQQITLQRAQFLRNKLHGNDQMQSQSQEGNQNQKPEAQRNVQNAEGNIVQQNEIKNKAQGFSQNVQFSYNQDQLSVEGMKKQQLGNKQYIVPVRYIENGKQKDIQSQQSASMRNNTQNNKKLKKLKQLGQNAQNSVVKQKIWSKLKIDIKKSVKIFMQDDQLSNVSWNKESHKLQKQIME